MTCYDQKHIFRPPLEGFCLKDIMAALHRPVVAAGDERKVYVHGIAPWATQAGLTAATVERSMVFACSPLVTGKICVLAPQQRLNMNAAGSGDESELAQCNT